METKAANDPRRRLGDLGERLACDHLRRAGYDVLDTNFRSRQGELDIVAADPETLIFCEVKTRVTGGGSGPSSPLEAIGLAKQRRLRRLAAEWLAQSGRIRGAPDLRFDAIGVLVNPRGELLSLEHLENAF